VLHHARRDTRYICNAEMDYASDKKCITFSNMRVDAAVSAEVLRAISPLAIDAALQLIADRERADAERLQQSELALEQARYEATHARRQYDAVDPDTGWSPASSNADGMNAWRQLRGSRSRSRASRTNSRPRCATTSARH